MDWEQEPPPIPVSRPPQSPNPVYRPRTSSIPTPRRAPNLAAPLRLSPWAPDNSGLGSIPRPPTPSQIPQSRFRKASNENLQAPVFARGPSQVPDTLRINKDLPPYPDTFRSQDTLTKVSGIPVKVRDNYHVAANSPRIAMHDNDSILNLPDGHRRSRVLGISGPTIRFSEDCDEGIMGPDNVIQRKDFKRLRAKTTEEIAASFRSNRTSDSMLASRLSRPGIATTLRGPEVKQEGLKSRMSAMLNRRPRGPPASTDHSDMGSPRIPDTIIPTTAATMLPPFTPPMVSPIAIPNMLQPNVARTADEMFTAGLRQVGIALTALGQAATNVAGTDETSQFKTRLRTIVDRVHQINEARVARLEVLNQLEALSVAEVVGISEAVDELNQLINQL